MKKALLIITVIAILITTLALGACASKAVTTTGTSTWTTATTTLTTTAPTYTMTTTATYTTAPPITITTQPPATITIPGQPYPTTTTIGLATGGAKDIGNFRENISNGYLPLPTDVTYEGLFYDYFFETGQTEPSRKLFSPSYSYAVTHDPLSYETDYYLSVGLNSGLTEADFQRKKLNLTIVIDNSGSMGGKYNEYYYDNSGNQVSTYAGEGIFRQTKMESANEAVVAILDELNSQDYLSIVTFNSSATLNLPIGAVNKMDMRDIADHVMNIEAGGSTNLESGIKTATQQYRGLYETNSYEYENRMIIITDAQPNTGDYSSSGFLSLITQNAANRIYTTFIGVGVDFNSQLIEDISKVKGANYYTVHSPGQFRERVEEEFEYMVTPLVFNLNLYLESHGWRIEKVFGSPEADTATGNLMHINTMFAAKSEGGENKGGIVLLKLRKTSTATGEPVYLRVSYEDRDGHQDVSEAVIVLEERSPEYFDNTGIRKAVLLTRYAALIQNWLIDERSHLYSTEWWPYIDEDSGIIIPAGSRLSQWERQSLSLVVSQPYKQIFRNFYHYFEDEIYTIGDHTLGQELDILEILSR